MVNLTSLVSNIGIPQAMVADTKASSVHVYDVMSLSEIADLLLLTPQRITQLVKEGMPRTDRNEYPLKPCVSFYIEYLRKQSTSGSIAQEKIKLYRAKAKKAELEVMALENAIIPVDEAKQQFFELLTKIKTLFLDMPGKLAPVLAEKNSAYIKAQIEKTILLTLNQIADETKETFDTDNASKIDGKVPRNDSNEENESLDEED